MRNGRMVYIPDENIMGEIVTEELYGAHIKFYRGGFEITEYLSAEDYEHLAYFEEDDD